jgi:CBS domain-containing protein
MKTKELTTDFDRLEELCAGELMGGRVIVIPAKATMHQAAQTLDSEMVGAAPIVDEGGTCVGVLSTRDFVTYEIDRTGDAAISSRAANLSPDGTACLPCFSVQRYMSTAVQTIAASAPLKRVMEMMLGSRIHHLVVLNADSKPLGVISTLDVLAAVNAIDDERRASPYP